MPFHVLHFSEELYVFTFYIIETDELLIFHKRFNSIVSVNEDCLYGSGGVAFLWWNQQSASSAVIERTSTISLGMSTAVQLSLYSVHMIKFLLFVSQDVSLQPALAELPRTQSSPAFHVRLAVALRLINLLC